MLNQNQFTENYAQELPRTKFHCPHNLKTTGNTGELIPIYAKEILPHDFISLDVRSLIKMTTPSFQTMDNIFCDIFFFFVPRRLTWCNWKKFQGEKTGNPREEQPEYTIPTTSAPTETRYLIAKNVTKTTSGTFYIKNGSEYTEKTLPTDYESGKTYYRAVQGWAQGTIADHLGIRTNTANIPKIDSAYFRGIVMIWNEWFRDEQRQQEADFTDDDVNVIGSNGNNYIKDALLGGKCLPVNKIHDYFTSTLLSAQDGNPISLPLGTTAPVYDAGGLNPFKMHPYKWDGSKNNSSTVVTIGANDYYNSNISIGNQTEIIYNSLGVDLTQATAATIAQLRMAFALQRIAENNQRSGTRYSEILANRWGVTPPDASLQRPEYLGGKRIPINIDMVVQTSSTDSTSPLGQISGFSNTFDEEQIFSKGFEEHGILFGFACIRHNRSYQQGVHRKFTRQDPEDFYTPEFANLGEQPIYNYEIYASGNTTKDNECFGYQEYGAEYRFEQNQITGQFRSDAENSLDNWHYADDYATTPVNSDEWIKENPDAVDRCLTIPHTEMDQFQFDFYFDETDVRCIPAHSIPGMMRI